MDPLVSEHSCNIMEKETQWTMAIVPNKEGNFGQCSFIYTLLWPNLLQFGHGRLHMNVIPSVLLQVWVRMICITATSIGVELAM